jgi:predicted transcriptional regulator
MATTTAQREHVNAFIDVDIRRELERLAHENDRSLSAEIRRALAAYVERDDETEEDR